MSERVCGVTVPLLPSSNNKRSLHASVALRADDGVSVRRCVCVCVHVALGLLLGNNRKIENIEVTTHARRLSLSVVPNG